jgi:signal transduction histidine kinase
VNIQKTELDRARRHEREAASEAELKILKGMIWFCSVLTILFLSMSLLVLRMIRGRAAFFAERERLFTETKTAVEARDEIIDAISQDLKEPLATIRAAISGLDSSLEAGRNPLEIEDALQSIQGTTLTIEGLIKDICDQTKADTGTLALRLDQLGVSEVLDEARVVLEPLAKQRNVRLQFETVNPPVLAFFDRERVIRVLANLVGNAIKFSPKQSKVIIKVRSDQQFVNISVSDSGPGIAAKNLPRLFGNFWQARKTADQGPGMGLAIVKTTVEAHGGKVKVESHPGHGSTFTFSLPRRRPVGAQFKRSIPQVRIVAPPTTV